MTKEADLTEALQNMDVDAVTIEPDGSVTIRDGAVAGALSRMRAAAKPKPKPKPDGPTTIIINTVKGCGTKATK